MSIAPCSEPRPVGFDEWSFSATLIGPRQHVRSKKLRRKNCDAAGDNQKRPMKGDAVTREPEDNRLQAKKERQSGRDRPIRLTTIRHAVSPKHWRKVPPARAEPPSAGASRGLRQHLPARARSSMTSAAHAPWYSSVNDRALPRTAAAEAQCSSACAEQKSLPAQQVQIRELAGDA